MVGTRIIWPLTSTPKDAQCLTWVCQRILTGSPNMEPLVINDVVILDHHNKPVRDIPDLPLTLEFKVPGRVLEAFRRCHVSWSLKDLGTAANIIDGHSESQISKTSMRRWSTQSWMGCSLHNGFLEPSASSKSPSSILSLSNPSSAFLSRLSSTPGYLQR